MRKNRIIALTMAVLMCLGAVAFVAPAASAISAVTGSTVVFVDGENGTTGMGGTPDNPEKSIYAAVNKVAEAGGGTVVVVGPVDITANSNLGNGKADVVVKITSLYDGVDYAETNSACIRFAIYNRHIVLKNAIVFEDISFDVKEKASSIYCDHYPLVMGYGVVVNQDMEGAYLNIYGGSARDLSACKNFPATASVTILDGDWGHVKASGKGSTDKPRDTTDAMMGLSSDFTSTNGNTPYIAGIEKSVITGKKMLIKYNGFECEETVDNTVTVTGKQGYIIPLDTYGTVYVFADKGYGAEIDGKVVANGKTKLENLNATIRFVESDVNANAEKELNRPYFPVGFPGKYMTGYTDGTFKPSKNITIAEASTIIVRLMVKEDTAKETTETSLPGLTSDKWYFSNVAYLGEYNFFDNFDNFNADRAITRAEFVSLINRAGKLSLGGNEIEFSDVAKDHKYYNEIQIAATNGLVNGYTDGTFKPEKTITRAEVVKVINSVFDVADIAPIVNKNLALTFTDMEETHWAYYQIITAAGGVDKPAEEMDLTGTGNVEYKVDGAVVYVSDKGSKDNDGKTANTPVTITEINNALEGKGGTIVVCGPLTWGANYRFGVPGYPVMLTSVYNGVDYREVNKAEIIVPTWKNIVAKGSISYVDNITFHTTGTNASIFCDNNKTVFGKDVVCVKDDSASFLNIYGGAAYDLGATTNYIKEGVEEAYGNILIRGGSWALVTATGKGGEKKPVHSSGTAVIVEAPAQVVGASAGKSATYCEIRGKRLVGHINMESPALPSDENADYAFNAKGAGKVEIVEQKSDYIVIKATADDGKKIAGLADDGTYKFQGPAGLLLEIDFDAGTAKNIDPNSVEGGVVEVIPDAVLAELNKRTETRIAEIKADKTYETIVPYGNGKTYYVSSSTGDDSNDGKTPETAWKTLAKLSTSNLVKGDVVRFKRGDLWRNVSYKAVSGVTYTAYGDISLEKPTFYGSPFDGAKEGSWTETEVKNVWKYSTPIKQDVGQLVFNNGEHGLYSQKMALKLSGAFTGYKDLKNDLEFFHDMGAADVEAKAGYGYVYLYSDKGNPAQRFTNIEFNRRTNVISAGSNQLFDNLKIAYGGSHGIGAGTCDGLTVQNCEFWWIGGAMQNFNNDGTRFGNAVEIYGGASNYTVRNCYIDEVYDAGVTHQVSHATDGDFIMKNVTYDNNVILRNVYSIEHFCRGRDGTTRYLVNIFYTNNICRFAGEGFGKTRPNKESPAHIRSGTIVDTANFIIKGNVFDSSTYDIFKFTAGGDEAAEFSDNMFIQHKDASFGTFAKGNIRFNGFIKNAFSQNVKDMGGNTFYFAK